MAKHNYKKSRLKYVFLAFTCATAFAFSGIAAACDKDSDTTDDETTKTTAKEDTQLLKNGNFEIFTVPEKKKDGNEPEYLIKTPENWSHGGTSSYTMSGIISTSETAWNKMKAENLADVLDYNNKLDSSSSSYLSEYVDYNGMKSSDILYKNQYNALNDDEDEETDDEASDDTEETEKEDRKALIENPGTHYNVTKKDDGKLYCTTDDGEKEVYVDDNGEYFLDKDFKEPISNVLMLHNYATSHNGIAQNYTSVEIELPANTAAEISVWVKTMYLFHDQGNTVSQDKGANISVTQTVGSSTLDKFMISCINTEKLLGTNGYDANKKVLDDEHNGWVQYTVYINACDFASSKIRVELGLGESDALTEGYAFFDDVKATKYISLDDSESYKANESLLNKNNSCNLSSEAEKKIFKADVYSRNNADASVDDPDLYSERNSKDFHYYIDLASEKLESDSDSDGYYTPVSFGGVSSDKIITVGNLKTGFTVDDDNYVSAKDYNGKFIGFTDVDTTDSTKWHLAFSEQLRTNKDLLAYVTTGYEFKAADSDYYEKLNSALNSEKMSADKLPKNTNVENNMLVMLSAYGAAYTTSFELSVPREGYQIISFWIKTSDMDGSTAATVSIKSDDDNVAKFTLDTTDKVTNIGDKDEEKDIFDGWVQCFFFVENELEVSENKEADTVTVEFSFGNTTIKGTDVRSFKNGWVALANMQILNVDEDIFAYTSSGDTSASLTISEEAEKKTQVFDDAFYNESHEIKNDMVIPSNYDGVNGGSSAIVNNGHVSMPFDEFTNNEYVDDKGTTHKFTGLINKEHFTEDDSAYADKDWFKSLYKNFLNVNDTSTIDAIDAWEEIFGRSVQPLIITNQKRTSYVLEKEPDENTLSNYYIKNDDGTFEKVADDAKFDPDEKYYNLKEVINYGYISEDKEVSSSSSSYTTVSIRVKVSANAVAYVYLVDTTSDKNVLTFTAPSYSFYYDVDGNVLRGEPKDNASYKEQRENILYKLRDDGLYEDENGKLYANTWNYEKLYYTKDSKGNKVYQKLKNGQTYLEENGKEVNHYLVTTDGVKVYEFIDGAYHYIVQGKTQDATITPFETQYARYTYSNDKESDDYMSEDFMVKIVGNDHLDDNGKPQWVTVSFAIRTGSEAKSYRLELWSGARDKTGTEDNENAAGGAVIFDYSYISLDDSAKTDYESAIIREYLTALNKEGALNDRDTTGINLKECEKLAEDNGVTIGYNYKAHYYTFSLYDSANYQPFNKEVASDGATGYDYSVSDQNETLAYLQVNEGNEYTIFADYSEIDKQIDLNNPTEDDTDETETETDNSSDGSIWLLASSIILVIALIFAIIAIFLKDVIKKARRNKVTSKNNYDQRKANRYKRKLHLAQEEIEEVDADESADAEEVNEVEETPEDDGAATEEAPEESQAEEPIEDEEASSPAEEEPATEENPDEGDKE